MKSFNSIAPSAPQPISPPASDSCPPSAHNFVPTGTERMKHGVGQQVAVKCSKCGTETWKAK